MCRRGISSLRGTITVLIVVLGISGIASGKVIYVDDYGPPSGDGRSWLTAYRYLQDALTGAQPGDEIRVAEGIYWPDESSAKPDGTGDRSATFRLRNKVTIKGGYAGSGKTDPNARDVELYETILSGDLLGNDGPDFANNGENSYRVVTGSNMDGTAILDGFTITAGNSDWSGGGMFNESGSPTVNNCTFSGNQAYHWGGGMFNINSSPTVTNCTFIGNDANEWGGGGMNNSNSSPKVNNCNFSENSAEGGGGGMNNENSNSTVTNCTFSNNSAGWSGGGMFNESGSPIVTNCMFSGNQAYHWGGGLFNANASSPMLTNCTFVGNEAIEFGGGGMSSFDISDPELINCILWGNTAPSGPQIYNDVTSSATVTYSDIQGGWPGQGNINANPYFADPLLGDFHLRSQAGRWNPDNESWIIDSLTSPCIDAGDLDSDWRGELWPHGCIVNMGAYGGTPEASMSLVDAGSIADLNIDGRIDSNDMKLLTGKWLYEAVLLAEDLDRDGNVNFADFAIFAHIRGLPGPASNPNPADGAMGVSITADLSWTASPYTTSHDVYFGTSNPPPFKGNQTTTIFDPGEMPYSTKYYWRIDEVGDVGTTNGLVWNFRTHSIPPP